MRRGCGGFTGVGLCGRVPCFVGAGNPFVLLRGRLFPACGDVPSRLADVELAGTADALFGVGDHFLPLGDPADSAGQREDPGEEVGWDAKGGLHDAGVKIDVRVEFAGDEVVVFEGDTFDFEGDFEERIVV